jgi:hypothetical protein
LGVRRSAFLALALFVAWVGFADDSEDAVASDDDAVFADALDG